MDDPKIVRTLPRLARAIQYNLASFGSRPPNGIQPDVYRQRPWYHDYSLLGVKTNFDEVSPPIGERLVNLVRRLAGKGPINSGSHAHQTSRDQRLIPLLEQARNLYKQEFGSDPQSFLDTMAADGFYAFYAVKKLGFKRAHCVDLEPEHISRGEVMRGVLNTDQVTFERASIYNLSSEKYDVGLSSGGLYHLDDPERLLKMLRERLRVLVVLTTVSQRNDSPIYKIAPAPGWQHGSAFSREWLTETVKRVGWRIIQREGFAYTDTTFDSAPEGVELLLCR